MRMRGSGRLCRLQVAMAIALCLVGMGAHAERVLTWRDCAAEAAQNNADLQAALAQWRSAGFLREGARGGYYPQISATAGYNYNGGSQGIAATEGGTYSAGVALTQNIFAGYLDQSKIDQSTANEAAAAAALAIVKSKLSFDLKSAYQGLLFAQRYQSLTQEILRRRQDNLRLVELRFDSGRENKGSVLLSRAYLAQAQLDALQARNAQTTAQTQLARVLGRDNGADIAIQEALPLFEPDAQPDFIALAKQTPDYQQTVAQEMSALAGASVARAPFYPSVNMTGQLNQQGSDPLPRDTRWSLGLNVTYPIYSGGKDTQSVRSARALSDAARDNRIASQRQLQIKLTQTHSGFVEAVQRLKTDQAFYDAAIVRAQIAREKYNNGLLTFDEWDIIENDLVAREKNRLQSERDRVIAQANWEQALGRGVIP